MKELPEMIIQNTQYFQFLMKSVMKKSAPIYIDRCLNFRFSAFMKESDGLLHVAIYCVPRECNGLEPEVMQTMKKPYQWPSI